MCGLHGVLVSVVTFKAKCRLFKSTNGCSHTRAEALDEPQAIWSMHVNFILTNYHFLCFARTLEQCTAKIVLCCISIHASTSCRLWMYKHIRIQAMNLDKGIECRATFIFAL